MLIRDRATLWKLAARPQLEFGEAYTDRRVEVEGDLADFLISLYRTMRATPNSGSVPRRWATRSVDWFESNTLSGSKKHIHHHYDIGNDFYKLWLDEEMVYTLRVLSHAFGKLGRGAAGQDGPCLPQLLVRPGETVVEAGCGWGAMALHMARNFGVSVKAFNISHEQIVYARRQAESMGLTSCVEFIEDDYRNIRGQFDAFVSVGMLEHVGPNHYAELGRTIHQALSRTGRGLIHSIGQNCAGTALNPWIRRRIFPGLIRPGPRKSPPCSSPGGSRCSTWRTSGCTTPRRCGTGWTGSKRPRIASPRCSIPAFVRTWRLYLAGSLAAFLSGELQLFQFVFARPQLNDIPWTRAALYPS